MRVPDYIAWRVTVGRQLSASDVRTIPSAAPVKCKISRSDLCVRRISRRAGFLYRTRRRNLHDVTARRNRDPVTTAWPSSRSGRDNGRTYSWRTIRPTFVATTATDVLETAASGLAIERRRRAGGHGGGRRRIRRRRSSRVVQNCPRTTTRCINSATVLVSSHQAGVRHQRSNTGRGHGLADFATMAPHIFGPTATSIPNRSIRLGRIHCSAAAGQEPGEGTVQRGSEKGGEDG